MIEVPVGASAVILRGGEAGLPVLVFAADDVVGITAELTGLARLLTILAKLGILTRELKMLSKLAPPTLAADSDLKLEAGLSVAVLSIEGGAEGADKTWGAGRVWAEPVIEETTPATDGMLVVMLSETSASVGKTISQSVPPRGRRGGASSFEG